MKNKAILNLVCFLMGFGVVTSSCEDMLTPDLERYTESFAQDTLYSFLGIMRSVQDIAERQVILGEARGDLTSATAFASDSISRIANYEDVEDGDCGLLNIADYYKIINQCNYYLTSADTAITQNGLYYMRREYAQVQAIRAWTYMQMVQFYGNVPFVTTPISNTLDGEAVEEQFAHDLENAVADSKVVANASNLVYLLQENGLDRALQFELTYGRPNYGNFSTGSGLNIASSKMMFPLYVIYGDLYLMANQYADAAQMYYNYMRDNMPYVMAGQALLMFQSRGDVEYYSPFEFLWSSSYSSASNGERLTLVAGAANRSFGRMLTAVANVYGFETTSSVTTSGGEETGEVDDSGEDVTTDVTTSGNISVVANENYRQLEPSQGYVDLSYAQKYCLYDLMSADNTGDQGVRIIYPSNRGDARIYFSAPYTRLGVDNDRYRIITKFTPMSSSSYNYTLDQYTANNFSISYAYSLYRGVQVWLRYAEAINRLGFPQHAFAVLKDGLSAYTMPTLADSIISLTPLDSVQTVYQDVQGQDSLGEPWIYTQYDTVYSAPYSAYAQNTQNTCGAFYITADELQRAQNNAAFMDFTRAEFGNIANSMPQNTSTSNNHYVPRAAQYQGIHSLGSGTSEGIRDTLFTYDRCVAAKIAEKRGYNAKETTEFVNKILSYGATFRGAPTYTIAYNAIDSALASGEVDFTKEDVIDAVEDLLVDEMALEFAFEGFRFGDLVRVAGHRADGVEWFANKIANRSGSHDASLFGHLSDRNNWFLPLPR